MTKESFGRRIDLQKMKKFIRERLSSAVTRVMVEEMFPSKAVVNEALLDLLFNTCPKLKIIVVVRSDFSKVSELIEWVWDILMVWYFHHGVCV